MDTVNETHERGELARLYREHRGKVSDRWRSYLDNYDRLFSSYREKPVRILEIGVQNGGSLDLWLHYFPNAKIIVGCDIDPSCAALEYDDPRIRVVVGDASAAGTAARIHEISDHFDITIDDGSHMARDVIRSFAVYFPRLTEGGLYVVEDLHCSYMHGYEGGLQAPYSSMSFFKRLADLVNREFWGCDLPLEAPLAYFARKSGATFEPRSLSLIELVSFRNSLCVIAKGAPEANALGERIVAGQSAIVDPVVARLDGNRFHGTDETSNPFGPLSRSSEEHVEERPVHFRRALSQNARILALQSEARDLKVALAGAKRADYDGRLPRKLRGLKRWLPGSGREIRQRTREYRIIAASALFDADWYLANNPDVAARKFDPVYHYLRYGAAEGRAPGPHFDAQDYLRANPDVAANGTNPLLDYLRHCRAKERRLSLSAPAISETLPQIELSGGIASSLQPNPVLTTGTWRGLARPITVSRFPLITSVSQETHPGASLQSSTFSTTSLRSSCVAILITFLAPWMSSSRRPTRSESRSLNLHSLAGRRGRSRCASRQIADVTSRRNLSVFATSTIATSSCFMRIQSAHPMRPS